MRIEVESIGESGERVRAGPADAWAVKAAREAVDAEVRALDVDLLLVLKADAVVVTGEVRVAWDHPCDRCAENVAHDVRTSVDLAYVPSRRDAEEVGEEGVELAPGDLDVSWYEGGRIDVGNVLTEAIALAMPARLVCPDEKACEERLRALVAARCDGGDTGHPGLAVLKGFRKN